MQLNYGVKLFLPLVVFCLFISTGFCGSSYDRELIVQDKTRAMQVESVFKEMMAAYEDEDARGFLDLVSDERFRQDYITFTDALYSDFRNYEIHQVEYWIDRIVPDNVKQFLFVKWEKRYENLDDGRQITQGGFSRFLFDEVDGDYLLIELAGNPLFGGSLQEWREEVPPISGQEVTAQVAEIGAICDAQHLSLCDESSCANNYGYWYDNSCHQTPYSPDAVCDVNHLSLCDESNCVSAGGYWYDDNTCNASAYIPPVSCDISHLGLCDESNCVSAGGYWYDDNTCNVTAQPSAGVPDLMFSNITASVSELYFTVKNIGTARSELTGLIDSYNGEYYPGIPALEPDQTVSGAVVLPSSAPAVAAPVAAPPSITLTIDPDFQSGETNYSNNAVTYP